MVRAARGCEVSAMGEPRSSEARVTGPGRGGYARKAQHGQNRAGERLGDEDPDDFGARAPIDPSQADAREADEGPEIRARVHERGHDVVEGEQKAPRE